MSNETADADLDAEMQQLMEQEAQEKAAAAAMKAPEPQPDIAHTPIPDAQVQPVEPVSEPVAPTPAPVTPSADDALEKARKKGLTEPHDIARAYQELQDEFHRRNQAGHPGYRDVQNGNPAPQAPPPPPNWNPAPQYPPQGYQYAPPPPSRQDVTNNLAKKYGMDPEDIERLMPMMVDAAEAIASRRTSGIERELAQVRQQSERSAEFQQLIQDPAFADKRVQDEMREVLKDGELYRRGGRVHTTAFQMALANLARKQLQQGFTPESRTPSNNPPVTAGGGNGSANTLPFRITDDVIASWDMKDQDAYFRSGGKTIPKR